MFKYTRVISTLLCVVICGISFEYVYAAEPAPAIDVDGVSVLLDETESLTRETFRNLIVRNWNSHRPAQLVVVTSKMQDPANPGTEIINPHRFVYHAPELIEWLSFGNSTNPNDRGGIEKIAAFKIFPEGQTAHDEPLTQVHVVAYPLIGTYLTMLASQRPAIEAHSYVTDISQIEHRYDTDTGILNLGNAGIEQIDAAVFVQIAKRWPELRGLNLSFNRLVAVPAEIDRLTGLQVLLINNNAPLAELPAELGNLHNLHILVLCNNSHLMTLPATVGNLHQLQVLQINRSPLMSVPQEIGQLANLEILDLAYTPIVSLPAVINNLPRIAILKVFGTPMVQSPEEWHAARAQLFRSHPHMCIMDGPRHTAVPAVGLHVPQPRYNQATDVLGLPHAHLQHINFAQIAAQFPELHGLDLSGNQLTQLSPAIAQLHRLESLSLANNPLAALPQEIGQLENLQVLDLFGTHITTLPPSMRNLHFLRVLILRNTPLATSPEWQHIRAQLEYEHPGICITSEPEVIEAHPAHLRQQHITDISQLVNYYNAETRSLGFNCWLSDVESIDGNVFKQIAERWPDLRCFSLNECNLTTIPREIGLLQNLEILHLCRTNVQVIPETIGQLRHLQELDLSANQYLISLPETINQLQNLRILNVCFCRNLATWPVETNELLNLRCLYCNSAGLTELPVMGNLHSLHVLDVRDTPMLSLGWSAIHDQLVHEHPRIQVIPMGTEVVTAAVLPARITNVSQLIDRYNAHVGLLDLTNTDIWQIDGNVFTQIAAQWPELRTLNLSNNHHLRVLPLEIGKLHNLQELILDNCPLIDLPESIGALARMRTLSLAYCHLQTLPATIGNLSSLQKLNLIENRELRSLPSTIGNLHALTKINVAYCRQLTALPKEIGNTRSLQDLICNGSSLGALPTTIGQLRELKKLTLTSTPIEELPPTIGNLENLRELNLSLVRIANLRVEIGRLCNLQKLSLYRTQIDNLPDLHELRHLQEINLRGTPLARSAGFAQVREQLIHEHHDLQILE